MTDKQFAESADPHAWLLVADDLHIQAIRTRENAGGEILIRVAGGKRDSWDITERATILLAAFAIENAIKAFLVYENPHWISNGRMARQLKSHDLLTLRNQSTRAPYRYRYSNLLNFLNDGIKSWARYPCALSANETIDLPQFSEKIWADYRLLMASYGRKLTQLLTEGWSGPHGHYGAWNCHTMKFLQEPSPRIAPLSTVHRAFRV